MIAEVHFPSYPEELDLLRPVLAQGDFGGRSRWVDEYEVALALHFGVARAVATSSGSAALHVALHVLCGDGGGRVALPATAPVPTVLPVLAAGLEPLFVDVEPDSFAFDLDDLDHKIDERCVAAITVPMWGYPHDYMPAKNLLAARGVALVEDAAHAHGTMVGGRAAGTIGTVGCFSTHQRKLLPTGEGGFLLSDDEELADRAKDWTVLGVGGLEPHAVNYKLTGVQAVLGRNRLAKIEERIEARARVVDRLLGRIRKTSFAELDVGSARSRQNHYALVLRLQGDAHEVARVRASLEGAGVPCEIRRFGGQPVYERQAFRRYAQPCPNAQRLLRSLFALPCHEGLTVADIEVMVGALHARPLR